MSTEINKNILFLKKLKNFIEEMTKFSKEQTYVLLKISDKNLDSSGEISSKYLPFFDKVINMAEKDKRFGWNYSDFAELKKDFAAVKTIPALLNAADKIHGEMKKVYDSAENKLYIFCMSYYYSVQNASKINEPGSDDILNEIKNELTIADRTLE